MSVEPRFVWMERDGRIVDGEEPFYAMQTSCYFCGHWVHLMVGSWCTECGAEVFLGRRGNELKVELKERVMGAGG